MTGTVRGTVFVLFLGLVGGIVLLAAGTEPLWAGPTFTPQADTFGQSDNSGPYDWEPQLLLKYSDGAFSTYHRKAWIRYDISSRAGRIWSNPTLALPLVDSGKGFTPADTEWNFQVYGLTDESLDTWNEKATWNDLPGNSISSGNGVDSAKTVSLGTFTIRGTGAGTTPTISGSALSNFLQSDTNGLVTMIVVRDSQAPNSDAGYVHAIRAGGSTPPATLSLVEVSRLTNGEFETTSGGFSLAGWSNPVGGVTEHGPLVPGSAKAAFLDSSMDARLEQTATGLQSEWIFDVFFATEDGDGIATDRGLNLMLAPKNGQINLRVNGAGSVQVYQESAGWQTLTDLGTVAFSENADGDRSFLGEDDTLNVYHLRILGHGYGTSTPTYDVLLSEANQSDLSHRMSGLSFFQFIQPTPSNWDNTLRLTLETAYGKGSYAVDAVYLASVPEPATLSLAAFGLLLSLGRVVGRRTR